MLDVHAHVHVNMQDNSKTTLVKCNVGGPATGTKRFQRFRDAENCHTTYGVCANVRTSIYMCALRVAIKAQIKK